MNIPNLPVGAIVDDNGNPTDQELTFRQNLITGLQDNFSEEGLVAPSQTTANITQIQNHTVPDPSNPMANVYTCQYGTFLYDETTNEVKVSVNNGSGVPIFKVVQIV